VNLSLRRRVSWCFMIANIVIISLGVMVYQFLHSLEGDLKKIMNESVTELLHTDRLRLSTVNILKLQSELYIEQDKVAIADQIVEECDKMLGAVENLKLIHKGSEVIANLLTLAGRVNQLKGSFSKKFFLRDAARLKTTSEEAYLVLQSLAFFLEAKNNVQKRDMKTRDIILETKRYMMITLIIGFFGCILLTMIVPGKIALPFKKINDAIRELQDCNFDVSIYYNQDDEIGEISREMNKMIASMKRFEELRSDRISVENRKFDALANLVKRPVMVANADSKVIYMNNRMYELLQIQSDDVINKFMQDTHLPETIVHAFDLAIKRRSKIENEEILIPRKIIEGDSGSESNVLEAGEESEPLTADSGAEEAVKVDDSNYHGYCNVIPIRGKDSSLDYYLMVMSSKVFA
jgi:PAS domain-containing protein